MTAPCRLWTDARALLEERPFPFRAGRVSSDGSNGGRALVRGACRGRLDLHESSEEADRDDGDDPGYETWVADEGAARALLAEPPGLLAGLPRPIGDRPQGGGRRLAGFGTPGEPLRRLGPGGG